MALTCGAELSLLMPTPCANEYEENKMTAVSGKKNFLISVIFIVSINLEIHYAQRRNNYHWHHKKFDSNGK
jgi:hypothetical protein